MAIIVEQRMKNTIKKCPHVLYVTDSSLQQRYPNSNHNVGCSDVEIKLDESIINQKITKYLNEFNIKNAVFGTIGPIDSKIKGQEYVIKALSKLNKKKGYNIRYELVGRGNTKYLSTIAKKYDFENNIFFVGEIKHDRIFEWIDSLDFYIQPSFQEGLCRAIVEAMSRGCIVLASDAGGNTELISSKYIFKKGNEKQILKMIENFNQNEIEDIIKKEYVTVQKYERNKLNKKRNSFFEEFFESKVGLHKNREFSKL